MAEDITDIQNISSAAMSNSEANLTDDPILQSTQNEEIDIANIEKYSLPSNAELFSAEEENQFSENNEESFLHNDDDNDDQMDNVSVRSDENLVFGPSPQQPVEENVTSETDFLMEAEEVCSQKDSSNVLPKSREKNVLLFDNSLIEDESMEDRVSDENEEDLPQTSEVSMPKDFIEELLMPVEEECQEPDTNLVSSEEVEPPSQVGEEDNEEHDELLINSEVTCSKNDQQLPDDESNDLPVNADVSSKEDGGSQYFARNTRQENTVFCSDENLLEEAPMEETLEENINDLPINTEISSPKIDHNQTGLDESLEEIDQKPEIVCFDADAGSPRATVDETNMNATNALKNLHELISNVTGVGEESNSISDGHQSSKSSTTPLFLPLVTPPSVVSCPNVTVIAPQSLLSGGDQRSSMETIGSKLLLLAAAQSASTSSKISSNEQQQLMPQLSVRPKDILQTSVKSKRLLLPKPVVTSVTTTNELPSSEKTLISSSSNSNSNSSKTLLSSRDGNNLTSLSSNNHQNKPSSLLMSTDGQRITTPLSQAQQINKMLSRTSVAPYMFEPPPPSANLHIPNGGYRCVECGDTYAVKTCLEFHLQRRSVMIETICIPCKQMFMFFNKCVYAAHIRMHRSKKWMTNVFRSVTVKPITWKLMEQWFEDTAFKRFSDPDAFFEYEFGGDKQRKLSDERRSNDDGQSLKHQNSGMKLTSAKRNSSLKCSECSTDLNDALALKRHFMYNLPVNQKQFICTACQAVYFSQCSFLAHKRTHISAAPFVCPECGEVVQSSGLLSSHLLSHRSKPTVLDSWRCIKCFTFYSSWEALVIHMAAAHCEMHHCCRSCTMAFASAAAFEEHKQIAHKYSSPETIEYRLLAKCCSCESLGFQGKDALIEHLKQHFGNVSPFKVFRCALCGRLMENKGGLVSHFKNVHRINVAPQNIEEDCIIIPSTPADPTPTVPAAAAASAVSLQQPQPTAGATQKYFSCKICRSLHFRSELGLKLHVKMKHSSDKPPAVPPMEQVKIIQQQNNPPPPTRQPATVTAAPAPIPLLSCYLCKKSFDDLESRVKDGLQHLKNGQVVCLLCQNLPMNSGAMLIRHFSKHIDEQERSGKLREGVVFVCNRHCKEEFLDRAKALNHLRSIHGQPILICDSCRIEFINEVDLRQHKTSFHAVRVDDPTKTPTIEHAAGVKRASTEVSKVAATLAKKSCIIPTSVVPVAAPATLVSAPTATATANVVSPPTTVTYGSYSCSKCGTKFDTREKMHQHAVERHKEAKFYTCLECATNFASPPSLGRHLITAHQIGDVERYLKEYSFSQPQKSNELECDVCHQVFQSKSMLDSHVRTHGLLFLKTQEKRAD